ncbi:MAG: helix-turn-helix domain-containing protein [Oscillospiraceae bacterium]|jgi:transcriptional regulator with XRE-family HTH domain|nr:helix-turn-helix domain-containing protein [Oscillospiraceae bacterium]
MDLWGMGQRIRKQREFLGYTREQLAELLDVTPKFCSDIELGVKGVSVSTLIRVSQTLKLPTDYILFGTAPRGDVSPISLMLQSCPPDELPYLETLVKTFVLAMGRRNA